MANQRDIVEIYFDEQYGGNHPAIIISNELVYSTEEFFLCVMMTSTDHNDEFSFIIEDEMVVMLLSLALTVYWLT